MNFVHNPVAHWLSINISLSFLNHISPRFRNLDYNVDPSEDLLYLLILVSNTITVFPSELLFRRIRRREYNELRTPGYEWTFYRKVIYFVVIKKVQKEIPLTVAFSEIVERNILLAFVTVEPV